MKPLPTFEEMFANEPGIRPTTDKALSSLIAQWWPDGVSEGLRGQALFGNTEDSARMTELFAAFGCKADAAAAPFALVWNACGIFSITLAPFVSHFLRHPESDAARYLDDWPQDWRDYVVAVAHRDIPTAERLFAKLQPLDGHTQLPPGCKRRKEHIQ